jgi:NAD(P)-dependent dehydrogenase (short-subunit alcohol dehydrogenase family)
MRMRLPFWGTQPDGSGHTRENMDMTNVAPENDRGLAGQTIYVSGAGAGIGRAIAEALGAAGANLALFDLDAAAMEAVAGPLLGQGLRVSCHTGDVACAADVHTAIEQAVQLHKRLDGAVNNAGIVGASADVLDYPAEVFSRVLDVNVLGVLHGMQAQLGVMKRQGSGAIVNIASAAAIIGWAGHSAYVASKHAVVGLTKTAALEYAAQGIRINAVCPAFIYTDLTAGLFQTPGVHDAAVANHPIGRLGQPREVAEAVMWLLSDRSSFAVGSSLVVDGASTID